ncbi:hypothetical protein BB560_005470 [Smittium megazygosporum]|uniref:Disintegrin domain-containing protein n=1 Tax=Smittium megazygosporum TaxID=133381 RepID=A0A2T9Z4Z1_9FUNG|nr:hypothetical protein BB560_005470 [Smittium megazygosporum]
MLLFLFFALIFQFERVVSIGKSAVISRYEFVPDPVVHIYTKRSTKSSLNLNHLFKRNEGKRSALSDVKPSDIFQLDIRAFNQTYRLILEPNTDLIHPNAKMNIYKSDGSLETVPLAHSDGGYFKGRVRPLGYTTTNSGLLNWESSIRKRSEFLFDDQEDYARVSIIKKDDTRYLDGVFYTNNEMFYIRPIPIYEKTKRSLDPTISSLSRRSEMGIQANSIIYRHKDMVDYDGLSSSKSNPSGCAAHDPSKIHRVQENDPHYAHGGILSASLFSKRQSSTFNDSAAIAEGCSVNKKILYMGAAADCNYLKLHGSSDAARSQILSNWNQASAVYERQINVALGLIYMDIVDGGCPTSIDPKRAWNRVCSTDYPISSILSDFSSWRGQRSDDGAGLWHLMTNCPTGSDVGLGWIGALCQNKAINSGPGGSVFSGTAVSAATREEWKVVAHEIGHNFGAIHDCTSSTCSGNSPVDCCPCNSQCSCNAQYIMNPSSPVATDNFSPCSIKYMCQLVRNSFSSCLVDPGTKPTLGTAMCGNGIVEGDEQCDCGSEEQCANDPCCDGKTCKLKSDAQCSDSNNLCCKNCKIVSKGTVCRSKVSECDIEEICDGVSSDCPKDKFLPDGTSCTGDTSGTKCASGVCTNRDLQCKARAGTEGYNMYCRASTFGNLCDIQCQSPSSFGTCVIISGSYIEGTNCGWKSYCRNGSCKGVNGFYTFLLIFQRSKYFTIPILIVLGLLILFIIYAIFKSIKSRLSRKNNRNVNQPQGQFLIQPNNNIPLYSQIPPPFGSNTGSPYRYPPDNNWVDPTPYNGYNRT